jgi:hypothetical protein
VGRTFLRNLAGPQARPFESVPIANDPENFGLLHSSDAASGGA